MKESRLRQTYSHQITVPWNCCFLHEEGGRCTYADNNQTSKWDPTASKGTSADVQRVFRVQLYVPVHIGVRACLSIGNDPHRKGG